MVVKDVMKVVSELAVAHGEMDLDQFCWIIQHHLQDKPLLGWLVLDKVVNEGNLEISDHEGSPRVKAVAHPPAE